MLCIACASTSERMGLGQGRRQATHLLPGLPLLLPPSSAAAAAAATGAAEEGLAAAACIRRGVRGEGGARAGRAPGDGGVGGKHEGQRRARQLQQPHHTVRAPAMRATEARLGV